jgi:hypothetical protein
MSVAIGGAHSRLRSQTGFAGAHPFIGEGAPHVLEQRGVKPFNGKGWDPFDRGERTINDG